MWLSQLLIASPVGVVVGYAFTAVAIAEMTWRWTFYFQAFMFIPCIVAFILTPQKYFDIEQAIKNAKIEAKR